MTHPFHHRLTPEERDLAARLARVGPHGEPPAALDARILAAAHAAVAKAPRAHRRWPAVLGVAATLAIAIGITWQLRPHDDTAPVLHEGPAVAAPAKTTEDAAAPVAEAASADAGNAGASAVMAPAPASESVPAPTLPAAPTPAQQRRAPADKPAQSIAVTGTPAPQRTLSPPEARQASDEPLPLQPPAEAAVPTAVMAPPPPAPPAPPPPARVAAPAPTPLPQSAPAPAMSRKAMAQPVAADTATEAALPRINGRAVRDVPVEEDARLEATDWLDRIRLRQLADDMAGARASLALFRRYYPDRAIPEDLAALAR